VTAKTAFAPRVARIDEDAARRMGTILAEAMETTGSSVSTFAPFIYPMRLVAEAASAEIKQYVGLSDDLIAVHESQSISCIRVLSSADELTIDGDFQAVGATMSISLNAESSGAELALRTVTRLRVTAAATMVGNSFTTKTRSIENAIGPVIVSKRLAPELVAAYADAAADVNPIHTDARIVGLLGFPERVVPGMLLAGLAEPAISHLGLGSLKELRTRFLAPCFVGERVSITVSAPQAAQSTMRRFRVTIARHEGPIACISDVVLTDD
jgi:acyl dehydratase